MKTRLLLIFLVVSLNSCNFNSSSDTKVSNNDTNAADTISKTSYTVDQVLSCRRFNKLQKFKFVNKKGFTFRGKGGTVLIFPPNVFNCSDNDSVNISITEFADFTSMINANLSTMTDKNGLLESNGMVYCKAYKDDKELELKKGRSFTCMFNKTKKNDYKLFQGVEKNGIVSWTNPAAAVPYHKNTKTAKVYNFVEAPKEALYISAYGTGNDIAEIESSLKFVDDSTAHITSYFFDKYAASYTDLLPMLPYESMILNFTLTKNGKLVFANEDNVLNLKVKSKLIAFFQNMPKMRGFIDPSTGAKEDLPIFINITPNQMLAKRLESDQANMSKVDKLLADRAEKEKQITQQNEKREKEEIEKRNEENRKLEIENEKRELERGEEINLIEDASKLAFSSTKLGWINCDRYNNDPRPRFDLAFSDLDMYSSFSIKIIFPKLNSIYQLYMGQTAANIPQGEPIKIIFVGIKDKAVYFFHKNMVTANKNDNLVIVPQKIDIADLSAYIDRSLN